MVDTAEPRDAEIRVAPYDQSARDTWNAFVQASKNGVFLFERPYMDYHADRFRDCSLLVFERSRLIAIFPASRQDDGTVVTHGGLTFGGVITDARMRAGTMLRVFEAILLHLRENGVRRIVYKAVPHIYHRLPAEEDLYALFRCGARLVQRAIAATVEPGNAPRYTKGRKWSLGKARAAGVTFSRSDDYETFMNIEERNLAERHQVRPVHTAAELHMLAQRFPDAIRLYVSRHEGAIEAGVVIYVSPRVAHAQYIASTPRGREVCAIDPLIDWLIRDEFRDVRYFDFGISTENRGWHLNEPLAQNKESYGGRGIAYDHYELDVEPALVLLAGTA
ncbi:MAG TPA: GNAT family N-acetyltransferase [Thermoanaerobaculia bacterium]|nr:GNAT family N-acetyltransferase [Thermoanaerobaculia bacterium]